MRDRDARDALLREAVATVRSLRELLNDLEEYFETGGLVPLGTTDLATVRKNQKLVEGFLAGARALALGDPALAGEIPAERRLLTKCPNCLCIFDARSNPIGGVDE